MIARSVRVATAPVNSVVTVLSRTTQRTNRLGCAKRGLQRNSGLPTPRRMSQNLPEASQLKYITCSVLKAILLILRSLLLPVPCALPSHSVLQCTASINKKKNIRSFMWRVRLVLGCRSQAAGLGHSSSKAFSC